MIDSVDVATQARVLTNRNGRLGFAPPSEEVLRRFDTSIPVPKPAAGPADREALNLLSKMDEWYPRDQDSRPTCVAHAAAAAVELLRAQATEQYPVRLSARFLHQRMLATRTARQDPCCDIEADRSDAKLCEAAEILSRDGICTEATWRESSWDLALQPSDAAIAGAAAIKARIAAYEDYGLPGTWEANETCRPPARVGLASRIYAQLKAGRPVCMAMPGWRARQHAGKNLFDPPMSWFMPAALRTGVHPDPDVEAWDILPLGGHVVCLIGFEPDPTAVGGGWFTFRNSWGTRFGSMIPEAGTPAGTVPHLHGPGFGAVSAWYMEQFCWEWLSLTLEPPP